MGRFEDDTRYFEIMLPTRQSHLDRGKKAAIASMLHGVGRDMIACVDADYDYLMQGASANSRQLLESPYIFHTYVYSIESYQCYAPGLHDICVMATLNDHHVFDFERYLSEYSRAIYPLFVWNIWCYRTPNYVHFTLSDFLRIVDPGIVRLRDVRNALQVVRMKAERKARQLAHEHPEFEDEREDLERELAHLGVTPDTTYLYIQGHHLFNKVVAPVMQKVCDTLVQERERQIRKKGTFYQESLPYQRLLDDVAHYLGQ